MFKDLFVKSGFEYNYYYDWNLVEDEKKNAEEKKN